MLDKCIVHFKIYNRYIIPWFRNLTRNVVNFGFKSFNWAPRVRVCVSAAKSV